jgi:hypothetical protein
MPPVCKNRPLPTDWLLITTTTTRCRPRSSTTPFWFLFEKCTRRFWGYCKDTYARLPSHSRAVCQASYDEKLTAMCNPSGFEYVPIARMPSSTVPDHLVQIKALRADIAFTGKKESIRWLGLQGGKYVSLPTEWVILNFDTSILEEATRRARMVAKGKKKHHDKFVPLPVGDSRDDDPPCCICNNKGLNNYYQGKTDRRICSGWLSQCCFLDDWSGSSQRLAT